MRGAWLCGAGFAGALSCSAAEYFVCNGDDDCTTDDLSGLCQPTGGCSYEDDDCESGQRYGASSVPSLAGECVQHGSETTGDPPPGTSGSSGGPSVESTDDADDVADDSSGVAATTGGEACPPDWWDCAWAYRQRLSVQRTLSTSLDDVPILILLGPDRVDYELMQADGEDLRFVDGTGAMLNHEVERWDPAGVSILWANLETLGGAADSLWLYYGNASARSAANSGGVWLPPHVGVWHLQDDPIDSTENALDAAPAGTLASAGGQIGQAQDFLSSNARLDVGAAAALADVFVGGGTVSAWIRLRDWGGGDYGRVVDKRDGAAGWQVFVAPGGVLNFLHNAADNTAPLWMTAPETLTLLTWTHVAVTFDASAQSVPHVYINGVDQPLMDPVMMTPKGTPATDLDAPLTIGNRPTNDRRFDGLIDEVRVERALRSEEWIGVQYESMRDELLTYGPVEAQEAAP